VGIRGCTPVTFRAPTRATASTIAAAMGLVLAVATGFSITGSAAGNVPLVATPTYVRTIGHSGEASMYPSGVAADAAGNVAVADTGNDRVEFFAAGSATPRWSVGVRGGAVSFQNPRDVAVDTSHVYVADTEDNTVQVLNKSNGSFVEKIAFAFSTPLGVSVGTDGSGHEVLLVSNGVSGTEDVFAVSAASPPSFTLTHAIAQFSSAAGTRDAATDAHGNIYVADYRGGQLVKYSPSGTLITTYGNGAPSSCDSWPKPYGVDVDSSGNVYIASSDHETIVKINGATGACVATYGTKGTGSGALFQLRRVAVGGPSNLVFAADLWGLKIVAYNQNGTISTTQPELGTPSGVYPPAGDFNEPHGIAVTSTYVYATDTVNQRMQRLTLPTGTNPIAWGTKGVQESTAAFNWAEGIGVDPHGNVWVANTRNNRIDEFGPAGGAKPIFVLGNRVGGGSVTFNWPMAVTFDPSMTMYVADTNNNRIQAFTVTESGTTTTATLKWIEGARGSGVNQFIKPWDVSYDAASHLLLVADTMNSRIVELNPSTGAWVGVLPITKGSIAGDILKPEGVVADTAGNIWVADTANNRVEAFTSAGAYTGAMVGGYGTSNTQLNFPQGVQIAGGLLYVGDSYNNRIQVFNP
jgi:sugar lactone lactonase YvrE